MSAARSCGYRRSRGERSRWPGPAPSTTSARARPTSLLLLARLSGNDVVELDDPPPTEPTACSTIVLELAMLPGYSYATSASSTPSCRRAWVCILRLYFSRKNRPAWGCLRAGRAGAGAESARREPVVKILAKRFSGDGRPQVFGRGGDDPHVDVDCLVLAKRLISPLGCAQQLGLKGRRRFGDFVEEESAGRRLLRRAPCVPWRPRKSPARVTEQLALEQPSR